MADTHYPHLAGGTQPYNQHYNQHYNQQHQSNVHPYVKAATAATAGGSLLVLSGLTLAGTVIALTVATPLLVIFSPILVPAVLTVFFLATGFLTSGGLGAAAATVLSWMYKYVTGGNPPGADSLDQATYKLGSKVRDVRDRAEHAGRETWDRAEHAGRGAEHAAGVGHQRTG